MDLDRYVTELRQHLAAAAEQSTDEARALVDWLGLALDSASRLVLIEALSDAAAEVSVSLAPAAVEVRMRGREPELVVLSPPSAPPSQLGERPDDVPAPGAMAPQDDDGRSGPATLDESATARTTLRLPDQLKERAEQAAQDEGLSLNAWLVRAVAAALDPRPPRVAPRESRGAFTGWVR